MENNGIFKSLSSWKKKSSSGMTSVADPDHFDTDTDPAFNIDTDPDSDFPL